MRKEMNSKSKRKWVAGGLAAFASVALLTTGFATWIVGTNKMTVDNNTTVNVATAQNASIELSMEITEANRKIRFAETSAPASDAFVRVDSGAEAEGANGDLTLDFTSIKVTYGKNSGFVPSQYKLGFTVTNITKNSANVTESANKVTNLGTFGRTNGTPYSYFQVPADIPLNSSNGTPNEGDTFSTYTFKAEALKIPFRWGTAFGNTESGDENQSPATFYNNYFNRNESEKTAANAEIVRSELAAMNKALDGATITLKAELIKIS